MHDTNRDRIRQYLVQNLLDGDPRGLDDDTDLVAAGLLDSLATLKLVQFLEQEFDTKLDLSRINPASLRTVSALADLVGGSAVGEDE